MRNNSEVLLEGLLAGVAGAGMHYSAVHVLLFFFAFFMILPSIQQFSWGVLRFNMCRPSFLHSLQHLFQ